MNQDKIMGIALNALGGAGWGLLPVMGTSVNYAVTAVDELVLITGWVAGEGIANKTEHPIIKGLAKGFGSGAIGLLSWNIGQSLKQ